MFCMSLNREVNREAFRADADGYLAKFLISADQKQAVLERDWLGMLRLGGNIYYTFKLAIFDRLSMQAVGGAMCDLTEGEFIDVMLTGGTSHQLQGERAGIIKQEFDNNFLNGLSRDPESLARIEHAEYMLEAGSEGIEMVMWMIMCGLLDDKGKKSIATTMCQHPIPAPA